MIRAVALTSLAVAALSLAVPQSAAAWFPRGPIECGSRPDGCVLLASEDAASQGLPSAAQPGRYTLRSVVGAVSFFDYARQSSQAPYKDAQGNVNPHPVQGSLTGVDYGIGPWTPAEQLLDPKTFNWASIGCAPGYQAASHWVRCDLTVGRGAAPNPIEGYIQGGVLHVTEGANPTIGQYVHNGDYHSPVPPYKITGGADGVYTLGGNPPDIGSEASRVSLNTSSLLTIAGFDFDDTSLFMTGAGVIDIHDNRFTAGAILCTSITGSGLIGAASMTNSQGWVYSNYIGNSSACSNVAMTYPDYGAQQSAFTGTVAQSVIDLTGLATVSGTTLTVTGAPAAALGVGTAISGTGCSAGLYIRFKGTGTGGAGTYTLGGAATGCTPTQAVNYTLTANGVSGTLAVGQYVAGPAAWTTPKSYQITDSVSGIYLLSPSNGGPPAVTGADMTTGPIQSTWEYGVNLPNNSGGQFRVLWNYADRVTTLAATAAVASVECSYNFVEQQVAPGWHGDACLSHQPSQTGAPVGSTIDIAFHRQNYNTILTDAYSVNGATYGGYSGTFAIGGGTASVPFFTNSGTSNHQTNGVGDGYFIHWGDVQVAGNTLINNRSPLNTSGMKSPTNAYAVYLDPQGSASGSPKFTQPGPYPGSADSVTIEDNAIDAMGALGCIQVTPFFYTTVGGSTPVSPTISGNYSLTTGDPVTTSQCQ